MSSTRERGRLRIRPPKTGTRMVSVKEPTPEPSTQSGGLIREAIFGINDGLVATVGLVSGESLSHQPHASIVIAGVSAVGAAMVSMAVGSYLATVSENDFIKKQIGQQNQAIQQHPHREKHHVKRLLSAIGVPPREMKPVTRSIVHDRPRWLRFMVREHLGVHEENMEAPMKNASVMGVAVILGSAPPIIPFLVPLSGGTARNLAWALSLATALTLGAIKGRLTASSVLKSALAFAGLAFLSAGVGAAIGVLLGAGGV